MNLSERMTRVADKPLDPRSANAFAPDAWRGREAIGTSGRSVSVACWETVEFECEIRSEVSETSAAAGLPDGVLAEMEL